MPMTYDEIYDRIKEELIDALGVDDDEVTPEATVMGDLGAESIDFLDIIFRLEKAFDIKVPREELYPDNLLNNDEYVSDGKVTHVGMDQLKAAMPHVDFSEFENDPDVNKISDLFTVDSIVKFVQSKLN